MYKVACIFIVVKYIKHEIYHFNHFSVDSSVALSAFTVLCCPHHCPPPEPFIIPNWNCTHWPTLPLPSSHSPRWPRLYFLSMDLTTLGTLYKWNHAMFVLLWVAYFTYHKAFRFHLCCSISEKGRIIFSGMYEIPDFVCLSIDGLWVVFTVWRLWIMLI